jgi:transcriptional regulator with XRE-family HTH domain
MAKAQGGRGKRASGEVTESKLRLRFFGDRIREAREQAGLSRRQLELKIGAKNSAVGRWERGEFEPQFAYGMAVCAVLGMKPTDLVGLEPAPDEEPRQMTIVAVRTHCGEVCADILIALLQLDRARQLMVLERAATLVDLARSGVVPGVAVPGANHPLSRMSGKQASAESRRPSGSGRPSTRR